MKTDEHRSASVRIRIALSPVTSLQKFISDFLPMHLDALPALPAASSVRYLVVAPASRSDQNRLGSFGCGEKSQSGRRRGFGNLDRLELCCESQGGFA